MFGIRAADSRLIEEQCTLRAVRPVGSSAPGE